MVSDQDHSRDVVSGAESFSYSVTDQFGNSLDGSMAVKMIRPDSLTISITDGTGPTVSKNAVIALDEEGLATANATGSVNNTSESAFDTVSFNGGSDAIASVVFGATTGISLTGYNGTAITWSAGGGSTVTGTIGGIAAITLTLTSVTTGAAAGATVTATLSDNFAHLSGLNENTLSISGVTVVATDIDGDPATATVALTIKDDVPTLTVSDTPTTVVEGATANGTWALTPGADGVTSVSVTFGTASGSLALTAGSELVLVQAAGTLTVRADHTFSYAAANGQDQDLSPSVSFTLAALDGDNDPTSDSLTISITDGAGPTVSKNAVIALDEEGLATANATGSVNNTSESAFDTVSFNGGSDAIASVVFGATTGISLTGYNGTAITWSAGGGSTVTGTIGGIAAITLTLTSVTTGAAAGATVTATLSDNFAHLSGLNENTLSISGVTVVATDIDGSAAAATVALTIKDDVPSAVADTDAIGEEGVSIAGNVISGVGADVNAAGGGYCRCRWIPEHDSEAWSALSLAIAVLKLPAALVP